MNLPDALYDVITADPPWPFRDRLPGKSRGASKHYPLMSIDELCALDVQRVAKTDCVLYLWRVSSMVEEAYRVVRAWGFTPKTEVVWRKLTTHGKLNAGMGRYTYNSHETVIVAVKGRAMPEPANRFKSVFDAPVQKHSAKPEEFYRLIEQAYPDTRRLELFARQATRPGWDFWGNEVDPKNMIRA